MILGAPVSARGVRVEIQSKLNALERMISKLDLIDPHQAFILLKNSFVIPKMTYLLRSSPAFHQTDLLQEFDMIVRNSMSKITNIDFTDDGWTQASLPVRSGGLGICKAVDISPPCYISSALLTHSLVEAILSSVTDLAPFEVTTEIELWKASGQDLIEPDDEFCHVLNKLTKVYYCESDECNYPSNKFKVVVGGYLVTIIGITGIIGNCLAIRILTKLRVKSILWY